MKMTKINIEDSNIQLNEYEKILSIDKILQKDKMNQKKKLKKFNWKKLIHQQEELNWKFLSYGSLILNLNNLYSKNFYPHRAFSSMTSFNNKKKYEK